MSYYNTLHLYNSKEEAEAAYNEYLTNHKRNIIMAYDKYHKALGEYLHIDVDRLHTLVVAHDNSKLLSKEEIYGHMIQYYPYINDGVDLNKYGLRRSIFEKALLHHYHNNPHHPEYWVIFRDNSMVATVMDNIYLAEMILDWCAHQADNRGTVYDYWFNNRASKYINYDNIKQIDFIVDNILGDDSDIPFLNSPMTFNLGAKKNNTHTSGK